MPTWEESKGGLSKGCLEVSDTIGRYVELYRRLYVREQSRRWWVMSRAALYGLPIYDWYKAGSDQPNWWLVVLACVVYLVSHFVENGTRNRIGVVSHTYYDLLNDEWSLEELLEPLDEELGADLEALIKNHPNIYIVVESLTIDYEQVEILAVYWTDSLAPYHVFCSPVVEALDDLVNPD